MKGEVLGPIMVYPSWSKIKVGLGRGRKERGFWKTCQSFDPGACFSKARRTLRARKATCQTAIHLFRKAFFLDMLLIQERSKRIAKFAGLESRRCEDIKRIVAPEKRPEKFRDIWETGPWVLKGRWPGHGYLLHWIHSCRLIKPFLDDYITIIERALSFILKEVQLLKLLIWENKYTRWPKLRSEWNIIVFMRNH